jgi:DNA adenine methylase
MVVPHPIPYQGSKRHLAAQILPYIPVDTQRLVEPFAGSGALSIAAAVSGKASAFWLNDINAPLMSLWEHILDKPQALANGYRRLWQMQLGQERQFYDRVRKRFNQTHQQCYFLYLLARCVIGAVRYNAQGEFNQSPDNRRKGRQPDTMRQDILQASILLCGKTRLTTLDYRIALQDVTPDEVVYLDPPYQGVCAGKDPRYAASVKYMELVEALSELNHRHIPYLVSYDGRTGQKKFGQPLPDSLCLARIELDAGRSSQATLLGRSETTYESLYLSPALVEKLPSSAVLIPSRQMPLFEVLP